MREKLNGKGTEEWKGHHYWPIILSIEKGEAEVKQREVWKSAILYNMMKMLPNLFWATLYVAGPVFTFQFTATNMDFHLCIFLPPPLYPLFCQFFYFSLALNFFLALSHFYTFALCQNFFVFTSFLSLSLSFFFSIALSLTLYAKHL